MITDYFYGLIFSALNWVVQMLPVVNLDTTMISDAAAMIAPWGQLVNLPLMASVFSNILVIEGIIWGIGVVRWLWDRIP